MKKVLLLLIIKSVSKSMQRYFNSTGDQTLHMLYMDLQDLHFRAKATRRKHE